MSDLGGATAANGRPEDLLSAGDGIPAGAKRNPRRPAADRPKARRKRKRQRRTRARFHRCPRCELRLPIEDFSPRKPGQGWVDRNGVNRYSYCRVCSRSRIKAYLDTEHGRAKRDAYNRAYYEAHKHDPDFRAKRRAYNASERGRELQAKRKIKSDRLIARNAKARARKLETQRLAAWENRRRMGQREIGPRVPLVVEDHDPYLDIEPYRDWIEDQARWYETALDLAEWMQVSQRQLERLRTEQRHVQLSSVDRVLTRVGVPLWEVYPDLYPGLDVSAIREVLVA